MFWWILSFLLLKGEPLFKGVIFINGLILMKFAQHMLNWILTLFCSWKFFRFRYGFRENLEFSIFFLFLFFNFQKKRSQKLWMLDEKQRHFWNLHWISHKVIWSDFSIFVSFIFLRIFFSVISKICSFGILTCNKKKFGVKIENRFV